MRKLKLLKMCEYISNGKKCNEESFENSNYCILHIDLPDDEKSDEFEKITDWKEEKIKQKIDKGDFNFEGAKLLEFDFFKVTWLFYLDLNHKNYMKTGRVDKQLVKVFKNNEISLSCSASISKIDEENWMIQDVAKFYRIKKTSGYPEVYLHVKDCLNFKYADIRKDVMFEDAYIGRVSFFMANIKGSVSFEWANICGDALFGKANIGGNVSFDNAKISNGVLFTDANIGGDVSFELVEMEGNATFYGAEIKGTVKFDVTGNLFYLWGRVQKITTDGF